jgi:hypothetical protein
MSRPASPLARQLLHESFIQYNGTIKVHKSLLNVACPISRGLATQLNRPSSLLRSSQPKS